MAYSPNFPRRSLPALLRTRVGTRVVRAWFPGNVVRVGCRAEAGLWWRARVGARVGAGRGRGRHDGAKGTVTARRGLEGTAGAGGHGGG
jgi:hypothetical protein